MILLRLRLLSCCLAACGLGIYHSCHPAIEMAYATLTIWAYQPRGNPGALLAGSKVLEKRRPVDGYGGDLRGRDLKIICGR